MEPPHSDRQYLCQRNIIAVSVLLCQRPSPLRRIRASSPKGRGFSHFRKRLSLLVAQKVPTVWNTCTMSTSSTTQTIMMLVW